MTIERHILVNLRTRLFQAWFRMRRPMTLGVRVCVENEAGEVLLVKHTYTPGWYFPGGGVEKNETLIEAARHELIEEAGLTLTGAPILFSIYSNHRIFPNDHVVFYKLGADDWTEGERTDTGEIAEIGWFSPAAPPEDATPATLRRLAELYEGQTVSENW